MVNAEFERGRKVIPGGVNSPVRAFRSVGGDPVFMASGEGAYLVDIEGRRYVDHVMSWGPMLFGHSHPEIVKAATAAVARGQSFGAATVAEIELAEEIVRLVPGIEKVRLVNSGTEATMTAVRVARAFTTRAKIVKFTGCYHGHADGFLIEAGSGALTLGVPSSPGVPAEVAGLTLNAEYNDLASVEELFAAHGNDIAAVIVEPVAGNMGCVLPQGGFLSGLREITRTHGALLIFDEVITGFRLGPGGAQQYFGIEPDLTCLGKILGGGFPIGAYGGRADIMALVAPEGPVYQAGTLAGGCVVVAAGLAMLKLVRTPGLHADLEARTHRLAEGLSAAAAAAGVPVAINHIASMLTVFFTAGPVFNYRDARRCDTRRFGAFFHAMLEGGVYLPPSAFECWFVSAAHTDTVLGWTVKAAQNAFRKVAETHEK